ncbi:MAG: peptide chain release factor N(5)-glutamine methyltransferase, partial [Candidatus Aminicenantes bacterium]|nr:peptide chain release factor N(5)-glutamine methyltransferase [Candidatus Aminicenantes bacterium]
LIQKRQLGFPLAYLTGKKEFWSLAFSVNASVLIPRPETELIVEKTIELSSKTGIIVDIGTGCGCIAASLAKELPKTRVVATDISKKSLETALLNAKVFKLDRIEFYQGNMFVPLKNLKLEDKCEIIVSNPPYVSNEEWKVLSVQITQHEPKKALVSGETGLECIEKLIHQSPRYLKTGGFLIFEFGAGQKERILDEFGPEWMNVRSYNDLYGIPRIMAACKK